MSEKLQLRIKYILGTLGLLNVAEAAVRSVLPTGKELKRHRQRMMNFYSQFVQPGDLCFDVGANLGSRVEVFLQLGAKVVAIEPQDNCMQYLRLKYGNSRNVILIHKGLDESAGERELLISSNDSAMSSMSQHRISHVGTARKLPDQKWNKTTIVPVTTLDSLISTYGKPTFCKIDVEGFEYQVLKGLSQAIRAVSFEYTCEYMTPALECIKHLNTLSNYEFNYASGETMEFQLSDWVNSDQMQKKLVSLSQTLLPPGDVYARIV